MYLTPFGYMMRNVPPVERRCWADRVEQGKSVNGQCANEAESERLGLCTECYLAIFGRPAA